MQALLLVALGGGLGSALRYGAGNLALRLWGPMFPWGTLVINVTGSFLIGLFIGWLALKGEASTSIKLFLATGLLGGFTTFSTFSLEALMLWERHQPILALGYITASVAAGLLAVVAGLWLGRSVF